MGTERVAMRALVRQFHDGRLLRVGDPFDAAAFEVAELVALGLACRQEAPAVPPAGNISPPAGRRNYKRRDLEPE